MTDRPKAKRHNAAYVGTALNNNIHYRMLCQLNNIAVRVSAAKGLKDLNVLNGSHSWEDDTTR